MKEQVLTIVAAALGALCTHLQVPLFHSIWDYETGRISYGLGDGTKNISREVKE
jgi:hypothetical protein